MMVRQFNPMRPGLLFEISNATWSLPIETHERCVGAFNFQGASGANQESKTNVFTGVCSVSLNNIRTYEQALTQFA